MLTGSIDRSCKEVHEFWLRLLASLRGSLRCTVLVMNSLRIARCIALLACFPDLDLSVELGIQLRFAVLCGYVPFEVAHASQKFLMKSSRFLKPSLVS